MNIAKTDETDLSEDLVFEEAKKSTVKTSLWLEKNMSESPFSRKSKIRDLLKSESWSERYRAQESLALKNENTSQNIEFQSLKCVPEFLPEQGNLQEEIKFLLQEAAKIRKCSSTPVDRREKCDQANSRLSAFSPSHQREITMQDVASP